MEEKEELILATYISNSFVKEKDESEKMYQVWQSGYSANGEFSEASYLGECYAKSFFDACVKLAGDKLDRQGEGEFRTINGRPMIWGCLLFDNEHSATNTIG